MPSIVLEGPAVPAGVHNIVIRDAKFHSPISRIPSTTDYPVIQVGIRDSAGFTSWIGTWDGSQQSIDAATPKSVLDEGRPGSRLFQNTAMIVKVTTTGSPATLDGSRVNFRCAHVGGRNGKATALIAPGVGRPRDPNAATALATITKQINEGGLSGWDDPVDLQDPVKAVVSGSFQGRLQVDSTTQISLQRLGGDWVEIDGVATSIGADGVACTTSDGLLDSSGTVGTTTPSADTLYYIYFSSSRLLRLSTTAPSDHMGIKHLGTDEGSREWRFCGLVYTDSSTQFVDDTSSRHLVNQYNRRRLELRYTGSVDNNGDTTTAVTATTWTSQGLVSFVSLGEDAVHAFIRAGYDSGPLGVGIGDNSATAVLAGAGHLATTALEISASHDWTPALGQRTIHYSACLQSAGSANIYWDRGRKGAAADVPLSYLCAAIWG